MIRMLVFILASGVFSVFIGHEIATAGNAIFFVLILGAGVFALAFFKRRFALILIALAILLSPEIPIARLDVQRRLVIRIEDIVILFSTFAWFASVAVNKELYLFKKSILNKPITAYLFFCTLTTVVAGLFWPAPTFNLAKGMFYILKYLEYFLIFFMFYDNVESEKEMNFFLKIFIFTGIVAAIYGITQIGREPRVAAPFDAGEANTFGGFLVIYITISLVFLLYGNKTKDKIWYSFIFLLFFVPFLHTLSRSSYLAFTLMFIYMIFRSKKGKGILLFILALSILMAPIVFPQKIFNRITKTVTGGQLQSFDESNKFSSPTLDLSAKARVVKSEWVFNQWLHHPIFGYGITGVGFIDNQMMRVLGEGGLLTFIVFIWLLVNSWKAIKQMQKEAHSELMEKYSFAMEMVLFAMIIHSLTANTFIISRIQENFWMLMGLLLSQHKEPAEESESGVDAPQFRGSGDAPYGNFISR